MKQTPILFRPEMIRALLGGRKTQTRRIMKPQPQEEWAPFNYTEIHKMKDGDFPLRNGAPIVIGWGVCNEDGDEGYVCKYGQPGDLLWVRETMRVIDKQDYGTRCAAIKIRYEADKTESNWIAYPERLDGTPIVGKCLAYGGYREASRLTLKITDIRVERVQEISEKDARAEGIDTSRHGDGSIAASCLYEDLWNSISGPESWNQNPYVWVITFEVIKQNIDEYLRGKNDHC